MGDTGVRLTQRSDLLINKQKTRQELTIIGARTGLR